MGLAEGGQTWAATVLVVMGWPHVAQSGWVGTKGTRWAAAVPVGRWCLQKLRTTPVDVSVKTERFVETEHFGAEQVWSFLAVGARCKNGIIFLLLRGVLS
jgi:hypothetical protein